MARGGFPGIPGGNMQQLMRQAQKMQQQMMKAQEDLDAREYEGTAGGGIYNNFLGRQLTAAVSTVETDSTALYTDWTWPVGKAWSINAGLRHTRE